MQYKVNLVIKLFPFVLASHMFRILFISLHIFFVYYSFQGNNRIQKI
jgi:hypothetical protein